MNKRNTIGKTIAVLVAGLLIALIFGGLPNTVNAAASLNVGDTVEVFNTDSEGLLVLDAPCGETSGGKFDGDAGVILEGPEYCYGHNRWLIRWSDDSLEGWSAEDWLRKKDISPSTKFSIGDTLKVYNTGDSGLVVRTDPPELAYKAMVYDGKEGTVKDGPFYGVPEGKTGFYYFWEVDYGDDTVGWSAEDWLVGVEVEDTTSPNISISSPSSGQTFTTPPITVSGTASDNVAVSKVEVRVGSGNWQTASGTTSWSVQVTLSSGSNTIYAKATDTSGNTEDTSVAVIYNPPQRIPTVDDPEVNYHPDETPNFNDDSEQIILARAIFGEARGESKEGKIGVGWVIRNRVDNPGWWGDSYHTVILKPAQFSAFNPTDVNYQFVINPLRTNNPSDKNAWYESYEIAGQILNNEVDDTIKGADHFYSADIAPPPWADEKKFTVQIGNHRFYRLELSPPEETPHPEEPEETPQPKEPTNPIQEVIEEIQEKIPPIQTAIEKIQGIIDKLRSLFGF